jgi:flagellar hook-length control protein FliK
MSHPRAGAETSPSSPAAQVGPALASFAASPARPGAAQHLTIKLDPAELGHLQMRIERTPGGPARIELIVERPDTLLLLMRDQAQLHRALDLAGVPAADRTLQFHLASPAGANPSTADAHSNADAGPGQQRSGQSQHRGSNAATFPNDPTSRPATVFHRAGVDITA